MHPAFEHLGVPGDADERAVKRAYAAKLKATRPDEDPEGFQRLHEAYQAALDWIRSGPHDDEADWVDDGGDEDVAIEVERARGVHADDRPAEAGHAGVEHAVGAGAGIENTGIESAGDGNPGAGTGSAATGDQALDAAHGAHDDGAAPLAAPAGDDETDLGADVNVAGGGEAVVFDHDGFFETCFELASNGAEGELRHWLDDQPILWSLAHKAQIGHWLLHAMHHRRPPMAPSRFDMLMDYFDLIDLRNGYDAYHIQRLRHRLQIVWELHTAQVRALAELTAEEGSSLASAMRQTARIVRQVTRPFTWPQALWAALVPMYPSAVRRFLHRLDHGQIDQLPPPIVPAQVAFWDAAADRTRMARQRLAVVASRIAAYAALLTLVHAIPGLLLGVGQPGAAPGGDTGESGLMHMASATLAAALLLLMTGAWLAWWAYDTFTSWQSRADDSGERWPLLRRLAIPVMLCGAFAILWATPAGWPGATGGVLLMTAALAAWARHRERSGPPLGRRLGYWHVFLLFVILRAIGGSQGWMDDTAMFAAIAGLALFIWAKDLWLQRRG